MSNKVTIKNAIDAVKAFAEQSEKNVAIGVLSDIELGKVSTFIKGVKSDILAMLVMQMAKDDDFKRMLFRAVEIYKIAPAEILDEL